MDDFHFRRRFCCGELGAGANRASPREAFSLRSGSNAGGPADVRPRSSYPDRGAPAAGHDGTVARAPSEHIIA